MAPRKFGIESDGFLELLNCLSQKLGLPICSAENDVELRAIAKLREHPIVYLLGGGELAQLEIRESQRISDIMIIRRQLAGRFKLAGGLFELADHKVVLAEHLVGSGALLVECQCFAKRLERFFVQASIEVSDRQVDQCLFGIGLVNRSGFQGRNGRSIIFEPQMDFAYPAIGLAQNGPVFILCRSDITLASMRLGGLIMLLQRILRRMEPNQEHQTGQKDTLQVHEFPARLRSENPDATLATTPVSTKLA